MKARPLYFHPSFFILHPFFPRPLPREVLTCSTADRFVCRRQKEFANMKRLIFLLAILVGLAPLIVSKTAPPAPAGPQAAATPLKMPTTITLATDAKLGPVAFNHTEHATGKRNIAGTGPIA